MLISYVVSTDKKFETSDVENRYSIRDKVTTSDIIFYLVDDRVGTQEFRGKFGGEFVCGGTLEQYKVIRLKGVVGEMDIGAFGD